ncbi:DUF4162 domain-containing protein [Sinobaca sp. H24]|uniref:ATP-binding protein DrrA1-3 family domain-containing protein n=1 Tax=Sinobaca sp. H24 TaxID=2923376 RepID=UPI00207A79EA|nr:DUF4162 domain-containing protein [Sinobaca sp. H24]
MRFNYAQTRQRRSAGKSAGHKRSYGVKNITIQADYDLNFLQEVSGVLDLQQNKDGAVLRVKDETIAEPVFQRIAEKGFVRKFEVEQPSLHDIFIDKAGVEHDE